MVTSAGRFEQKINKMKQRRYLCMSTKIKETYKYDRGIQIHEENMYIPLEIIITDACRLLITLFEMELFLLPLN
jgi:hypothetical protein